MISSDARDALLSDPTPDRRADDRRRAAISRMARALAREMLAGLRESGADIPQTIDAEATERVVDRLASADRALAQRLGVRADVHAAMRRLRLRAESWGASDSGAGADPLDRLIHGSATGAAFTLYRRCEAARLDPFGDPVVTLDELGRGGAAALGWTLAAAIRSASREGGVDDGLSRALTAILDRLSGRDAAADAASTLVHAAVRGGQKRMDLALAALDAGWLTLAAASLADLLDLDPHAAIQLVLDGDAATLARAAAPEDRSGAAALLLAIARARHGDEDDAGEAAAAFLSGYDAVLADDARRRVATLGAPQAYRDAVAAFGLDGR